LRETQVDAAAAMRVLPSALYEKDLRLPSELYRCASGPDRGVDTSTLSQSPSSTSSAILHILKAAKRAFASARDHAVGLSNGQPPASLINPRSNIAQSAG
jgi:hypothetical protein